MDYVFEHSHINTCLATYHRPVQSIQSGVNGTEPAVEMWRPHWQRYVIYGGRVQKTVAIGLDDTTIIWLFGSWSKQIAAVRHNSLAMKRLLLFIRINWISNHTKKKRIHCWPAKRLIRVAFIATMYKVYYEYELINGEFSQALNHKAHRN